MDKEKREYNICQKCGKQTDRPLRDFTHVPQKVDSPKMQVCFPCYNYLAKEYVKKARN